MPLTMLNMVALIPMPSASVITAIVVNPGFFTNCRKPYRRSRTMVSMCAPGFRLCRCELQGILPIHSLVANTQPKPWMFRGLEVKENRRSGRSEERERRPRMDAHGHEWTVPMLCQFDADLLRGPVDLHDSKATHL